LKALSLTQPMAWAIFNGKNVENRTWRTNYRGPLLIHASMNFDAKHLSWLQDNATRLRIKLPDHFYHGAILGMVDIIGCVAQEDAHDVAGRPDELRFNAESYAGKVGFGNLVFTKWFTGPFGFLLANAREFQNSIPYRGTLGIFNIPDEVVQEQINIGELK